MVQGGRSVGIVRSRTKGHGVCLFCLMVQIDSENLNDFRYSICIFLRYNTLCASVCLVMIIEVYCYNNYAISLQMTFGEIALEKKNSVESIRRLSQIWTIRGLRVQMGGLK
jgi:hypothetical protein